MRRLVALLVILATTAVGPAAELTVEVVLDCSASMNRPLSDRRTRLVAATDVTAALVAALPEDGRVHLGLRTVGGTVGLTAGDACDQTSLVLAPAALDRTATAAALSSLGARGRAPLAAAVAAVRDDLADSEGPQLLLVLTDGVDSCGGDLESAFVALRRELPDLTIQVIGLALPPPMAEIYTSVVPVGSDSNTPDLVKSVATTVAPLMALDTEARPVAIDLIGLGGEVYEAELTVGLSGAVRPLAVAGSRLTGEAPGGFHDLTLRADGGEIRIARLFTGSDEPIVLELPPPAPATTLTASAQRVESGAPVTVHVEGAPPEAWLTLVSQDAPAHEVVHRHPVDEGDSSLVLTTLPIPTIAEARLHRQLSATASVVVATTAMVVAPGEHWLTLVDAPEVVESDDHLAVAWFGPGGPDDVVTIVPATADPEALGPWVSPHEGAILDLWAPTAACAYEIRYLTPAAGVVMDRVAIDVVMPLAELRAPAAARAGSEVAIRWYGPGDGLDFITIVEPTAAAAEYRQWRSVGDGSPLTLAAPREAGEWEIRYVRGTDNRVLDRIPLTVEAVAASIEAPATVRAGTRFQVTWNGPDGRGDFIAVAPTGSGARTYQDFAFTSLGSPANLAAPFQPGDFEVRYISAAEGSILAAAPLRVE